MNTIKDYLNTYSGKKLLEKHSLEESGTWKVLGEDSNCDFGGHHHQPYLGTYDGKLRDVVNFAVEHKNFWTWGYGGSFEKIEIIKISAEHSQKILDLKRQKEDLEEQLRILAEQLKKIREGNDL